MNKMSQNKLPLPPFDQESTLKKVRLAEDGWNSRDPLRVAQAYAVASRWRNRSEFINGRDPLTKSLTVNSLSSEALLVKSILT